MSLIGLQTAVAAIIRNPRTKYKWNPQDFLSKFDLTNSERRIVEKLSLNIELNKYGKDQSEKRFQSMKQHCKHVSQSISNRVLRKIWFDLFEPVALYGKSKPRDELESTLSFLNFLLVDKNAQKRLKRSAPPSSLDLIQREIEELEQNLTKRQNPSIKILS